MACSIVIVANVFNMGTDLSGMVDRMQMMTGTSAEELSVYVICLARIPMSDTKRKLVS